MSKPLVIYHADCADGFCSAWLFHFAFPDADFHPARYEDPPPEVVGRDVYIVDFSYPLDVTRRLVEEAASVVILDHHRSAEPVLRAFPDHATFDTTRSGCRLAWEWLWRNHLRVMERAFPGKNLGHPPWIVLYVEARDLWKWNLPYCHQINAAIRSRPFDFSEWDQLNEALDRDPTGMRNVRP